MIGGLLVGSVLALTCATLSVYYEREPKTAAHAAATKVTPPVPPLVVPVQPEPEIAPLVDEEPVVASAPTVAKRRRQSSPSSERPPSTPRTPTDKAEIF